MIDALRKNEIDVAFLWSICPETFSFTLYEALAAGCFVITNPASGNIQAYIKANPAAGLVVDDEHALMELFEGNTLVDYIAEHQADGKKGANLIINHII
jgi:glycosyltransferase involved in cell wall biosynthesis